MTQVVNYRHRFFAQALVEYRGNKTRAYLAVFPKCKESSARACASRLSTKANIFEMVDEILKQKTPILERIVDSLSQSVNANKIIIQNGVTKEVADYRARENAIKVVLSLYGLDDRKGIRRLS